MADQNEGAASLDMAFASPIMRIAVPDADALNEKIIAEAYALRDASEGLNRSNRNGWHSKNDLMQRTEPGLSRLASLIPKAVNMISQQAVPEFDTSAHAMLVNGWININPQHGYNAPHTHRGFMWSGCYYVKQPPQTVDEAGSIQFLAPWQLPHELERRPFNLQHIWQP